MTAIACETWGLVFWDQTDGTYAALTGPESRTSTAPVPPDATFVGIQFAVGTSPRSAALSSLLDYGIALPDTTRRSFWLDDYRFETPTAGDAEALTEALVRRGVVDRDPLVAKALAGEHPAVSERTLERRFRRATGLSQGGVRQIERARHAAELLAAGEPVSEVVAALGYYDEPHLARALRRYVGRTTRQLRLGEGGLLALETTQRVTS